MTTPSKRVSLSVVVPAHNRQEAVNRAVQSILAQEVDGLEVILVDDGSSPPLVCSSELVKIVRHDRNRGAAAARNSGASSATGEWVAFLDSDDVWLPKTLAPRFAFARAADALDENKLTVHVAGFIVRHGKAGKPDTRLPRGSANPLDFASGCWFAPGSTALFRREPVLSRVGGQDETLRRFEDNDWFLRLALAGGVVKPCPIIAAEINVARKPTRAIVDANARLILAKVQSSVADAALRKALVRRLKAWWALERASSSWHAGNVPQTALDLSRSLLLAPRLGLHLVDFWQSGDALWAAGTVPARS